MKAVTIRELHAKTGRLLREASHHGQILVTDNGRPIARILPDPPPPEAPYFARRVPTAAFKKLDESGKTGRATDITEMISQDRDDQL